MKKLGLTIVLMLAAISIMASSCKQTVQSNNTDKEGETDIVLASDKETNVPNVQVAILLDVSGSMDGLIEQAKSRLWNIVNTMTTLKYKGKEPKIEIALYAYGVGHFNDGVDKTHQKDYLYQITHFTTDLDLISEKLFALRTSGSQEYCGTVIHRAVKDLEWGNKEADMKLIYIAGNEIFEQGKISFKTSIPQALEEGIYVNTIHCGGEEMGIRDLWRDAAMLGKGKFFNIDANERVRYIETPYDERISSCNLRLNDTYIGYGSRGFARKENQALQDRNAASLSSSNMAERAVSKSKAVYQNEEWDLVDANKNNKLDLDKLEMKDLPAELQDKSKEEITLLIDEKTKERESIQKEIADLAKLRQEYIDKELQNDTLSTDLGKAISQSIIDLAEIKGYTVTK